MINFLIFIYCCVTVIMIGLSLAVYFEKYKPYTINIKTQKERHKEAIEVLLAPFWLLLMFRCIIKGIIRFVVDLFVKE